MRKKIDWEQRAKEIKELLNQGVDKEEIARRYGYKSWMSLYSSFINKGYHVYLRKKATDWEQDYKDITILLKQGVDREKIARRYGYKSWKVIQMVFHKHGLHFRCALKISESTERMILDLYKEGKSIAEIAEVLGIPRSTTGRYVYEAEISRGGKEAVTLYHHKNIKENGQEIISKLIRKSIQDATEKGVEKIDILAALQTIFIELDEEYRKENAR